MEDLEIPWYKVLPYRYSPAPPWKLPAVDHCQINFSSKKDHSEVKIRGEFLEHLEEHEGSMFVFTDGSKSDAGIGFGVVSKDFKKYVALPRCTSTFTAELYAILTALKQIVLLDNEKFVIFIDSQSALKALNVFNPFNPLVNEIL